jgi:hypothetical protein
MPAVRFDESWVPGFRSSVRGSTEVGAFYWTDMAPDIVNPGREEQGSVSV